MKKLKNNPDGHKQKMPKPYFHKFTNHGKITAGYNPKVENPYNKPYPTKQKNVNGDGAADRGV